MATYRFTAEEKKSGNVLNRPRFGQEEEAIQNMNHVHVLPDVVGVHTTADGLSQAEEHVFALKMNKKRVTVNAARKFKQKVTKFLVTP